MSGGGVVEPLAAPRKLPSASCSTPYFLWIMGLSGFDTMLALNASFQSLEFYLPRIKYVLLLLLLEKRDGY